MTRVEANLFPALRAVDSSSLDRAKHDIEQSPRQRD
jgi:hypothetical protein